MAKIVRLRLHDLLAERGMTQKDFALRSGISENAVSKIVNQQTMIKIETMQDIINTLGCDISELFEVEEVIKVL
jgi:transcriptional regulator with XRE-family HTH domain